MRKFDYVIKDPEGIHARPATVLVQETRKEPCDIKATCGGTTVDAKSIFGLMSLGAKKGMTLSFVFSGDKENEAYDTISRLVEENF